MFVMANQTFLRVWCRDFSEDHILETFGAFLGTVPFSKSKPGFTHFIARAVEPSEWPVLEQDLRNSPFDAAGIVELAQDQLHSDCSYEVNSAWDLWIWEVATDRWKLDPQPLEIFGRGEDYDNAIWREEGHIEVNLGFEHLVHWLRRFAGNRLGRTGPAGNPGRNALPGSHGVARELAKIPGKHAGKHSEAAGLDEPNPEGGARGTRAAMVGRRRRF